MFVSVAKPQGKGTYNTCLDCGKQAPGLISIKHELWKQTGGGKAILCLSCMERRLGRKITFEDLLPCGSTNSMMLGVLMFLRDHPQLEFSPTFYEDF